MRALDFTSWQGLLVTLFGLMMATLVGIGLRMLLMVTVQQRRERMNRQINERLRTLIAAYKVLGGSFTGELTVNPAHLRDRHGAVSRPAGADGEVATIIPADAAADAGKGGERARRVRDAVEAALSDIILLGTEEHVRLAERAARDMSAGRHIHTHDLVVALRRYIREALDLEPLPSDLDLPKQGPARLGSTGGRGSGKKEDAGRQGGAGGGMGMGMGMGGDTDVPDGHPQPPPDRA